MGGNAMNEKQLHLNRRKFLQLSLAGIAASQLSCTRLKKSAPNILIFVADDTGWADVGFHNPEIQTPNIDQLAQTGLELNQFYAWPTCSPTRASLLTGRPASRFGILAPITGPGSLPTGTVTLAELLRQHGYHTAITGKWHLGLRPEVGPNQFGFEHSYGYFHGQIDPYTHHYKNGDPSWHRNGKFIEETGHATDLIAREANFFLTQIRDKSRPFLLYVPFSVPHYPLQEPEEWLEKYPEIENPSRRAFAAATSHFDAAIGKILNTLEHENLAENTLVIFMSDNGGQENWYPKTEYARSYSPNDQLGKNVPLRGWKGQVYEGGIRVPAIFRWPGKLAPGKCPAVTCATDILPTVAALAKISLPENLQIEGQDIWPVISGKKVFGERRLYWRTPRQLAIRLGDWKLVHHGATPETGTDELFDLKADPLEQFDLAAQQPEKRVELKHALVQEWARDN
jgi:arylsulfatase A-like enzyme